MEMGGFSPVGVEETPPICEAEQLNGLPINRVGPRILYVVRAGYGEMRFHGIERVCGGRDGRRRERERERERGGGFTVCVL